VLFCNPDISIASRVQTVLALADPSKSFGMQHLAKRFPPIQRWSDAQAILSIPEVNAGYARFSTNGTG
jgi:hypothetical protein